MFACDCTKSFSVVKFHIHRLTLVPCILSVAAMMIICPCVNNKSVNSKDILIKKAFSLSAVMTEILFTCFYYLVGFSTSTSSTATNAGTSSSSTAPGMEDLGLIAIAGQYWLHYSVSRDTDISDQYPQLNDLSLPFTCTGIARKICLLK